jgi:fucose permease
MPILGIFAESLGPLFLYVIAGLHGAFLAPTYPIAVAHANDRVERKDVVAVSGALIIVNGVGSAVGPALAGWLWRNWALAHSFWSLAQPVH